MNGDSSDTSGNWDCSDRGMGTSVESISNTENYSQDTFERDDGDLSVFRQKLLRQDVKLEKLLNEFQNNHNELDLIRLNREREILSAHLKTKLLVEDFKKRRSATRSSYYSSIGCVNISNVRLQHVKEPNVSKYFLCVLTCGSNLSMSRICEADKNSLLDFNINSTFTHLPVDFEISIKIYILSVTKKNCLQKFKDRICSWFGLSGTTYENTWRRESLFKLWRTVSVKLSDINNTKEAIVDIVESELCRLFTDVTASVNTADFCFRGWLDISRNGLFWNQKWCVLEGTIIKCFNYPVDDIYNMQYTTIDLKTCKSVRFSRVSLETRRRNIILHMQESPSNPLYFYLTTDSINDFRQWRVLAKLVQTLHYWKIGN